MTTTRSRILAVVRSAPDGGLPINEVATALRLDRSTIYHHAKILAASGDITFGRELNGRRGKPPLWLVDPARPEDRHRLVLSDAEYKRRREHRPELLASIRTEGPGRAQDLARRLGVPEWEVRQDLERLADAGTLTKVPTVTGRRGKPPTYYRLADPDHPTEETD